MKKIYTLFLFSFVALVASAMNYELDVVTCKVAHEGFAVVWGEVAPDNTPAAGDYAIGGEDNKEVFFRIVPKSGHTGCVRGVIDGDKILVELPQAVGTVIDEETGEEVEAYADLLHYEKIDGYDWYVNSGEKTTLELDLIEGGGFSYNLKTDADNYFPALLVGIVTDLAPESCSWTGFGDWSETFTPFNEQPLALPEGLETETWRLFHEYEGRDVSVAIDGNDIWLGNLTDELPDSYVKGTIKGDKVTFPLAYLGYSKDAGNFLYFVPCYWEEFYYEPWDEMVEDYIIHDTWTFDYDAEAKTLSNIEDFAAIMIGTSDRVGEMAGSYVDMYFEPEIMFLDPAHADDPFDDPEFLSAYHDGWYDVDMVEFFIPSMNQGGYPLDTDRLSYVFYVDRKPLTLTTDVYVGLEENMTQIPFDFCDWENQDIWSYGQEHQICLYQEPESYTTVGLKVFYEKEDGTIVESNYVEANIEELSEGSITTGIGSADAAKKVKSVEYFDMQGRMVSKPANGMFIKVKNYADGSRKVTKSMAW